MFTGKKLRCGKMERAAVCEVMNCTPNVRQYGILKTIVKPIEKWLAELTKAN